jgi:hypothetical protein
MAAGVAILVAAGGCDGLVDGIVPDNERPKVGYVGIDDGDVVSAPEITIDVVASDDRTVDEVRWSTQVDPGRACTPLDGERWRCGPVPLRVGDTRVTFEAWDGSGNRGATSLTLRRPAATDTTPPSVAVFGVGDGDEVAASEITIGVVASDDRGVDRVDWSSDHGDGGACTASGGSTWACGPIPLPFGDTTIEIEARDLADNRTTTSLTLTRPTTPEPPPPTGGFDIDLLFFADAFTASQRDAFTTAADRWEAIVTGDLQSFPLDRAANASCGAGEPEIDVIVDDLLIFVTSDPDGEEGGVLGIAGPCLSRTSGPDQGTNAVGFMEFDTFDLAILESDGDLVETIVHEMGHVLGLGTNWEFAPYYELLDYDPSDGAPDCATAGGFFDRPEYTGAAGVAAYGDLGGFGDVPVEESGGIGTQCGHWDEERFGNELMTGFLEKGQDNPLSEMTIASLEDIGLTVDRSRADAYALPLFSADAGDPAPGLDLAGREILLRPRGGIDPATGEVTWFDPP